MAKSATVLHSLAVASCRLCAGRSSWRRLALASWPVEPVARPSTSVLCGGFVAPFWSAGDLFFGLSGPKVAAHRTAAQQRSPKVKIIMK